jgi:hypothetical protein
VKKAGTWLQDLTSALRALMAPIEQRGIDKGVVQKWPVLGNTDNKNPAARQGWF